MLTFAPNPKRHDMNTQQREPKRQNMFADIVVEDQPTSVSRPVPQEQRMHYLKLVYPNGVSLVLPGGMSPATVMEYIKSYRP